jgi:hypothetical protein
MSEELSERVETVYADVYAYPLALALVLARARDADPRGQAPRPRGAAPAAARKTRRPRKTPPVSAAATGLLSSLLLSLVLSACEQANQLFMRSSPVGEGANRALDAGDAGAAVSLLEEYLSTGKCENGNIGAPSSISGPILCTTATVSRSRRKPRSR